MASSTPDTKIPNFTESQQLDRTNWLDWKDRVTRICKVRKSFGHLDGSKPRPPIVIATDGSQEPGSVASAEAWDDEDEVCKAIMILNIKHFRSSGVAADGKTAAEIWRQLKDKRERTDSVSLMNAVDHVRTLRYTPGSDLYAHFEEMHARRSSALELGASLPDAQFAVILCRSMPQSMRSITVPLLSSTDPDHIISTITTLVEEEALTTGKSLDPIRGVQEQAFIANTANASQGQRPTCSWCLGRGHAREQCYVEGGGRAGQQPAHWKIIPKGRRGSPAELASRGTPSANVATTGTTAETAAAASVAAAQAHKAHLTMQNEDPKPISDPFNYHIFLTNAAIPVDYKPTTTRWTALADSGATHHYFTWRDHFSDYVAIEPRVGHAAGMDSTFSIIGLGTVHAMVEVGGKRQIITFRDAVHAPGLATNLISLARIDRSGRLITMFDGTLTVYDQNAQHPAFTGKRLTTDLYEVVLQPVSSKDIPAVDITYDPRAVAGTDPRAFAAKGSPAAVDLATWHRRLGHVSERTIQRMISQGLVNGLNVKGSGPTPGKCEDCIKGKQTREPFYPAEVETEPGERVYIDLMGRFQVPSLGGAEYALTCNDGGTSYAVAYPIASKAADVTLSCFHNYRTMLKTQTGRDIRRVRYDNGKEFMNAKWDAYFAEHGIIAEPTTPYTPEQNGVAERGHRTIGDHVRAMLFDASIPNYLWAEALMCWMYIQNITCSARQDGRTPFERWNGHKPNIAHLRAFGSVAYAKVPDATRKKLDPKSTRCIMVGYTEDASYRLWDPTDGPNGRVFRARDVTFEEGPGHRTLTADGERTYDIGAGLDAATAANPVPIPVVQVPTNHVLPPAAAHIEEVPDEEPLIAQPAPPRRSTRLAKVSQALQESKEAEQHERESALRGAAWANDGIPAHADQGEHLQHAPLRDRAAAYVAMLAADDSKPTEMYTGGETPTTYKQAMKEDAIWAPAMAKEIDGLMRIGAWELVPRTPEMNVVGCKWAYARKHDETGKWKPKARLVAKGFHQIPGVDFFETHASVVRFESLRTILATATYHDMAMGQDDVEKAYLNATPQETIYMEQPPGFESAKYPDHVARILRSLYGLMQSGNDWWKDLDVAWEDLGFERSRADECVRARFDENGLAISATYTDDITSVATTDAGLSVARKDIGARYRLSGGGELRFMLGVAVERDKRAGTTRLTQRAYAERILQRFNMQDANPVITPLEPGQKLSKSTEPTTPEEALEMASIPYREALGAIMYLSVATRPDLSYPVQMLSRFMTNPGISHWRALKRVLRYIKGTLDYGIVYRRPPPGSDEKLQPVVYADASHGDCPDSGRTTHGHVAVMAGGPVSWSSRRQDVVALSTTEAEYIAVTHAGQTALWLAKFMGDIYIPIDSPVILRMDSSGGESLAKQSMNFSKVRHLHVRYHWLRDAIRLKELAIIHIPGSENPADIFTKALGPQVLQKHLVFLGIAV